MVSNIPTDNQGMTYAFASSAIAGFAGLEGLPGFAEAARTLQWNAVQSEDVMSRGAAVINIATGQSVQIIDAGAEAIAEDAELEDAKEKAIKALGPIDLNDPSISTLLARINACSSQSALDMVKASTEYYRAAAGDRADDRNDVELSERRIAALNQQINDRMNALPLTDEERNQLQESERARQQAQARLNYLMENGGTPEQIAEARRDLRQTEASQNETRNQILDEVVQTGRATTETVAPIRRNLGELEIMQADNHRYDNVNNVEQHNTAAIEPVAGRVVQSAPSALFGAPAATNAITPASPVMAYAEATEGQEFIPGATPAGAAAGPVSRTV